MKPSNEILSPEDLPENRKRIEKEIRDALLDCPLKGTKLDVTALVDVVTAECQELRERIADRIIGQLIGRYDNFSDERLELLAHIVKYHFEEGHSGSIELLYPPHSDFTVPAGLRSV